MRGALHLFKLSASAQESMRALVYQAYTPDKPQVEQAGSAFSEGSAP